MKPAFVVLDSITPLSGKPGEGKSDFIIKTYKALAKEYGAPVLFIAHEQKESRK
jgi:predicted ATP-dependent serine protease